MVIYIPAPPPLLCRIGNAAFLASLLIYLFEFFSVGSYLYNEWDVIIKKKLLWWLSLLGIAFRIKCALWHTMNGRYAGLFKRNKNSDNLVTDNALYGDLKSILTPISHGYENYTRFEFLRVCSIFCLVCWQRENFAICWCFYYLFILLARRATTLCLHLFGIATGKKSNDTSYIANSSTPNTQFMTGRWKNHSDWMFYNRKWSCAWKNKMRR